jgi:hypothetical protein
MRGEQKCDRNIMQEIKRLGLSMRLLGILRHEFGMTFLISVRIRYLTTSCPGSSGHRNVYEYLLLHNYVTPIPVAALLQLGLPSTLGYRHLYEYASDWIHLPQNSPVADNYGHNNQ